MKIVQASVDKSGVQSGREWCASVTALISDVRVNKQAYANLPENAVAAAVNEIAVHVKAQLLAQVSVQTEVRIA